MTSTIVETPTPPPVVPAVEATDLKVTQLRLIRSEWVKFWSLRSSYITLAAALVGMIGFGALFAGVTANRWSHLDPGEQLHFEATGVSLRGYFLAQLIIGVLGVLLVTGEYSTGMIRASMAAAPKRLPVIWAKAAVFTAVVFLVSAVASVSSYLIGQQLLSSTHIQTTLSETGVLRTVMGTALYLTAVGLFGVGLGWIIRSTAGGIATLFGLLLVLPALASALPSSWGDHINPYLPSNAGQDIATFHRHMGDLAPWTGFGVFCLYVVAAFIAAAVLVKRRDA
jgi:ABC-type transport system involved in multi-copper enzyme maturation permease subunit